MMNGGPLPRLNDAAVVCVIDDDEDVCKALERLLRSTGLAVETFPSPQAFLAYPLADRPSCLVLDVQLPGQSGLLSAPVAPPVRRRLGPFANNAG
jgi:FixJ family two-component response regulator